MNSVKSELKKMGVTAWWDSQEENCVDVSKGIVVLIPERPDDDSLNGILYDCVDLRPVAAILARKIWKKNAASIIGVEGALYEMAHEAALEEVNEA